MTKLVAAIVSAVALLITVPIWLYLLWYVLTTIGAGELQMFLFWIYAPLLMLVQIILSTIRELK